MDERIKDLERQREADPGNTDVLCELVALYERTGRLYKGKTIQTWIEQLSGSWQEAWAAAEALKEIGPLACQAVEPLTLTLSHEYGSVRMAGAQALGQIGIVNKGVLSALLNCLQQYDSGIQMGAAEALGELGVIGRELVIPALLRAMSESSIVPRRIIGGAIEKIGEQAPEMLEQLIEGLADLDREHQDELISALRALRVKGVRPGVFVGGLHHKNARVRSGVALVFQYCTEESAEEVWFWQAFEALKAGLSDPSEPARLACLESLGTMRFKSKELIPVFASIAGNKFKSVRNRARELLQSFEEMN